MTDLPDAKTAWAEYTGKPVSKANPVQPLFLAGFAAALKVSVGGLCRQEFYYRRHTVPYLCVLTSGHEGPHQCSFSDGAVYQSGEADE